MHLDVVRFHTANFTVNASFVMIRVPISGSFDPSRLNTWLSRSERLPYEGSMDLPSGFPGRDLSFPVRQFRSMTCWKPAVSA